MSEQLSIVPRVMSEAQKLMAWPWQISCVAVESPLYRPIHRPPHILRVLLPQLDPVHLRLVLDGVARYEGLQGRGHAR